MKKIREFFGLIYTFIRIFFMKRPKTETVEIEIDEEFIENEDFYKIIEPCSTIINIYEGLDEYEQSKEGLTLDQSLMNAVYWVDIEVSNGGFDQFYFNSTGILWQDVKKGFQRLNLHQFSKLIDKTVQIFGESPKFDRELRWEQMDKKELDFDLIDDEFYKLLKSHDLEEIMLKYIRENKAQFLFNGTIERCK